MQVDVSEMLSIEARIYKDIVEPKQENKSIIKTLKRKLRGPSNDSSESFIYDSIFLKLGRNM